MVEPARPSARRTRPTLAAVAILCAVLIGVLAYRSPASSTSVAPPSLGLLRREDGGGSVAAEATIAEHGRPPRRGPLGEADGAVPDGTTVFDDEVPGVANLDPDLLRTLRVAASVAADDGIAFFVDSGWRSAAYQARLFSEAVAKYGSAEEAARWVAGPTTSAHVSGDAVDIGHAAATAWLSEHGAVYGLCQIYGNEPWHYELRHTAIHHGCPPTYADASDDPRLQQ